MKPPGANRPFRWDLVRGDELGTLLEGIEPPDLWFVGELVECAAKVVARSAGGDLYFVGRSPDSIFDLLSGAFSGTSWHNRVFQLPLSLYGPAGGGFNDAEQARLRATRQVSSAWAGAGAARRAADARVMAARMRVDAESHREGR